MSTRKSGFTRYSSDHFEPQEDMDLAAQRRLRGQLEHIDYTVFASNREVIHATLGSADAEKFQRLAVAAALARAQWVKEALAMSENPTGFETRQVMRLAEVFNYDIDFAQGLRRLMRADPDIILIGECRDEETASAAVNAALTGHLVLTTLHANDCLRAVSRFISMGVPPYLLADSLALTQAQRLVRRLCGQCKRMAPVTPEERRLFAANKVPLPPEVNHIYEAEGCPECRETGYRGRIALMELCPVGHELADLISVNAPQGEMRKIATAQGLRTLYQEGLQQVMEGNTSLEEIKCLAYTAIAPDEVVETSGSGGFEI